MNMLVFANAIVLIVLVTQFTGSQAGVNKCLSRKSPDKLCHMYCPKGCEECMDRCPGIVLQPQGVNMNQVRSKANALARNWMCADDRDGKEAMSRPACSAVCGCFERKEARVNKCIDSCVQ